MTSFTKRRAWVIPLVNHPKRDVAAPISPGANIRAGRTTARRCSVNVINPRRRITVVVILGLEDKAKKFVDCDCGVLEGRRRCARGGVGSRMG